MARKNLCALCHQRRGKRMCPAAGGVICPQCCGKNRSLDFGCPPSCSYLRVTASQSPRLNEISLESGWLIERGEYDRAVRMLAGALNSYPRSLQLTINYAGALLLAGYPDHAWKVMCNAWAWVEKKNRSEPVDLFNDNMTFLFGIITDGDAGQKEFLYDKRKYLFVRHPGPPPPDMLAGLPFSRQRISLCMIARNEARCIGRALDSVRGYVDEIVLVDTGSTDDTAAIAESYGARVYQHPWTDDFSESRNHSLDHATGDWILVLDPDETVNYLDLVYLKELAAAPKHRAFSLRIRHYARERNVFGLVENDDDLYNESDGYAGWAESALCRFFRRDPQIRYRRPVHEVVEPSLRDAGVKPLRLDVAIHHYGKAEGKESRDRKSRHYIDINRRYLETLEDRTERLWSLFQIGQSLTALGEKEKAVPYLEEAVDLMDQGEPLKSSDTAGGPVETLAHLYLKLDRPRDAERLLREQIERDPENSDYRFFLAKIYTTLQDYDGLMHNLQEWLAVDPDNGTAREMQRGLRKVGEKLREEVFRDSPSVDDLPDLYDILQIFRVIEGQGAPEDLYDALYALLETDADCRRLRFDHVRLNDLIEGLSREEIARFEAGDDPADALFEHLLSELLTPDHYREARKVMEAKAAGRTLPPRDRNAALYGLTMLLAEKEEEDEPALGNPLWMAVYYRTMKDIERGLARHDELMLRISGNARPEDFSTLDLDPGTEREINELRDRYPFLDNIVCSTFDRFCDRVMKRLEAGEISPLLPFAFCARLLISHSRRVLERLDEGRTPDEIRTAFAGDTFMEEVQRTIGPDLEHGGREALEKAVRLNLQRAKRENDTGSIASFTMLLAYVQASRPPYADNRLLVALYCYSLKDLALNAGDEELRFINRLIAGPGGREAAESYIEFLAGAGRDREAEKMIRLLGALFPEAARGRPRRRRARLAKEPEGQLELPLD